MWIITTVQTEEQTNCCQNSWFFFNLETAALQNPNFLTLTERDRQSPFQCCFKDSQHIYAGNIRDYKIAIGLGSSETLMHESHHLQTNKPSMYLLLKCTWGTFEFRFGAECEQVTGQRIAREPCQIALGCASINLDSFQSQVSNQSRFIT